MSRQKVLVQRGKYKIKRKFRTNSKAVLILNYEGTTNTLLVTIMLDASIMSCAVRMLRTTKYNTSSYLLNT